MGGDSVRPGFAVVMPGARRVHARALPACGPLLLRWGGVVAHDLDQVGIWRREAGKRRGAVSRAEALANAREWLGMVRNLRERASR